jgi:beta-carotene 15,15'-dioxygenase
MSVDTPELGSARTVSPADNGGHSSRKRLQTLAVSSHHSTICIILVCAMVAQWMLGSIDLLAFPLVAALLVLGLGVPHGAFDIAVLKYRWHITGVGHLALVLILYLALAGLMLIAWWRAPGPSLVIFLMIAAYHFGGDWMRSDSNAVSRSVLGGALLTATTVLHREQAGEIFSWLAPLDTGLTLASWMQTLATPLLITACVIAVRCARTQPVEALEIAVAISAAVVLPPITFFLLYFCLLHSVRHLLDVNAELASIGTSELLRDAAPYAALAIGGTMLGAAVLGQIEFGHDLLAAVFITLAALTVPHMLLIDAAWARPRRPG